MAHHLNDKLEWFLMQLTKGAGVKELNSFKGLVDRNNYQIIRPLINTDKNTILDYLKENKVKSFYDDSNSDESIKRNYFRHNFSNKLVEEFKDGISKSFKYIDEDEKDIKDSKIVETEYEYMFIIYSSEENSDLRSISKVLKYKFNKVLSQKVRTELLKTDFDHVFSGIAVEKKGNKIYIAPYQKANRTMTKKEKDTFRTSGIPSKIRGYIINSY
jgi:tRNA(Ile)-lysidine synthase